MDVEKSLEAIGSCGLWQIWVYFWIFYGVCFFAAINVCIVFMQDIPDFICENPLFKLTNWTFEEIQMISTPKHSIGSEYNGCKYYNRSYENIAKISTSFNETYNTLFGEDSVSDSSSESVLSCNTGPYNWNTEGGMHLSVVNQWDLVCDNAFQVSSTSTAYMVGFFFGCLCSSFLSDRLGRKKVVIVGGFLAAIAGVIDPWIPNFYIFLVGRFFMAFFMNLVSPAMYVLCLELCTDSVRKPLGALYFVAYSIGYAGLCGVAYFRRDWRVLHSAISAPMLILPLFYWIVNAFVYYGISYLITSFSGDIFINNAISGALETPAYLLCYPMLFWARKGLHTN